MKDTTGKSGWYLTTNDTAHTPKIRQILLIRIMLGLSFPDAKALVERAAAWPTFVTGSREIAAVWTDTKFKLDTNADWQDAFRRTGAQLEWTDAPSSDSEHYGREE